MEVSSLMHNSKYRKLTDQHDMDGHKNSIENLPDEILQYILSFIATKDVVGTSILSKRWECLWMSVPNLHFQQGLPSRRPLFMNFVDRVFLLRDLSNVEKFSLMCDVQKDASRIDAWICATLKREVKELNICLSNFEEPFVLPRRLFSSESLTMLKLQMDHTLKYPHLVHLSSLKILTLTDVLFPRDPSIQQLFSGCPVLEELCIDKCDWTNVQFLSISCPKLWKLTINETVTDDYAINRGHSDSCHVKIFGSSLKYFYYSGQLRNVYFLYNSSSLLKARISFHGSYIDNAVKYAYHATESAYRADVLFSGLSSVKDLILSTYVLEVLGFFPIDFLSTLHNCTKLEFHDGLISDEVLHILQIFPCLESILFSGDNLYQGDVACVHGLDPVPLCFSTTLKKIEVENFHGCESELVVIELFLEEVTVLKTLVIYYARDLARDIEELEKVRQKLLMFPRGSGSCSFLFLLGEGN